MRRLFLLLIIFILGNGPCDKNIFDPNFRDHTELMNINNSIIQQRMELLSKSDDYNMVYGNSIIQDDVDVYWIVLEYSSIDINWPQNDVFDFYIELWSPLYFVLEDESYTTLIIRFPMITTCWNEQHLDRFSDIVKHGLWLQDSNSIQEIREIAEYSGNTKGRKPLNATLININKPFYNSSNDQLITTLVQYGYIQSRFDITKFDWIMVFKLPIDEYPIEMPYFKSVNEIEF